MANLQNIHAKKDGFDIFIYLIYTINKNIAVNENLVGNKKYEPNYLICIWQKSDVYYNTTVCETVSHSE